MCSSGPGHGVVAFGRDKDDGAVKTAGAQQDRVQNVRPVGGREDSFVCFLGFLRACPVAIMPETARGSSSRRWWGDPARNRKGGRSFRVGNRRGDLNIAASRPYLNGAGNS
jgi:hypothetical protein